jgi:hypothetical protein
LIGRRSTAHRQYLSDSNYSGTARPLMVSKTRWLEHKFSRVTFMTRQPGVSSAFTNHLTTMTCCANPSSSLLHDGAAQESRSKSTVVAYVGFAGSVIFTLAAASAVIASDLPLPLFG